jgi:DNA-binding transcriptional regulator YhcF (GntR family)
VIIPFNKLPKKLDLSDYSTEISKSHSIKLWLGKWIKRNLENKSIKAGDLLTPVKLIAEYLEVKTSCIHLALRLLQEEGYVQLRLYSGAIITNPEFALNSVKPITKQDQALQALKKYIQKNCEIGDFLPSIDRLVECLKYHKDLIWRSERILFEQGILYKQTKGRQNLSQWRVEAIPIEDKQKLKVKLLGNNIEKELREYIKKLPPRTKLISKELAEKYKVNLVLIRKILRKFIKEKLLILNHDYYTVDKDRRSRSELMRDYVCEYIEENEERTKLPRISFFMEKFGLGEASVSRILQAFVREGLLKFDRMYYWHESK